ncbi:MAG: M3 family metallopeptidase, partial [Nanoarchaeota archaeon]
MDSNPLLERNFAIPFDRIKAEHIEPAARQIVAEAEFDLERIVQLQKPRTFENTLTALDKALGKVSYVTKLMDLLESTIISPEIQEAYNTAMPIIDEFSSKTFVNAGLWNALQQYAASCEASQLEGPRKRFLAKNIELFLRYGANLDEGQKLHLTEIDVELGTLTAKYKKNTLDSMNSFSLIIDDPSSLTGLPEREIAAARQRAQDKGFEGWRFTLQNSSYLPLMTYLNRRDLREKVYKAFCSIASEGENDNRHLITEILRLRKEKAKLLGYDNFADMALADRMAKNGGTALAFLQDLKDKSADNFQQEFKELQEFTSQSEGSKFKLAPWDLAYYSEKLRAAKYNFEEKELEQYFSLPNVLEGLFAIVNRLYGIRVEETYEFAIWHKEVKTYKVFDKDDTFLGAFYADLFTRETKKSGAWMNGLIYGGPDAEGFKP